MIDRLRRIQYDARLARDQWLHPLRRRAARKMLAEYRGTSILVLCQGNVCRSPFAHAVLEVALPAGIEVRSAGFVAEGRCPPPEAISVARHFGFDLSLHRSRHLTAGLAQAASLIVLMDPSQARQLADLCDTPTEQVLMLGDLDSLPIDTREIIDPIHQPRDVFVDCYDRIDRCARELSRALHRAARTRAPMYGEQSLTAAVTAPPG